MGAIGYRLVCVAVDNVRGIGLKRIECSCLADNQAAIKLLRKAGFRDEGIRLNAVLKRGELRNIRLFGLLL